MRSVAGIDCGSGFTKAVIIAENGPNGRPSVLGRGMTKTGVNMEEAATRALDAALSDALLDRDEVTYVATTGFGRYGIAFRDIQITEITSGAQRRVLSASRNNPRARYRQSINARDECS